MFQIKLVKKGLFFNIPKRDQIIDDELRRAMEESVLLLEREVKKNTPVGVGGGAGLAGSISGEIRGRVIKLQGIVGTPLKYAVTREKGRNPGRKFPDVDSLEQWVKKKTRRSGEELRRLTFIIGRKIARFGYKGAFMFDRAFQISKGRIILLFKRFGALVVRRLDR